jgi:hypothetical protein
VHTELPKALDALCDKRSLVRRWHSVSDSSEKLHCAKAKLKRQL